MMAKTYGSETSEYLNCVQAKTETNLILKQIAQNLAYIADELSDANDINKKSLEEVYRDITNSCMDEEDEEDKLNVECVGAENCFICGKPVDFTNAGGMIVTGDGDTYCACSKCKNRFDALVQVFVMPNEVYC